MDNLNDRLSPRARDTLDLAAEEARHYARDCVAAEHLLLALLGREDCTGARVLGEFGVTLVAVRPVVEALTRHHAIIEVDAPPLSSRALTVMTLAQEEAREAGQVRVGTGHLLLGLVRENQGIPAGVLASMGVSVHHLDQIRKAVRTVDNPPLI